MTDTPRLDGLITQRREIERLRDNKEKVRELLEEIADLAPVGKGWGLALAALEILDSDPAQPEKG